MALQEKQLAQSRPSSTSAVSIYSPPASTTTILRTILVCNTSNSNANFRIFLDDDGTTYDESTALFFDVGLSTKETEIIEIHGVMNSSSGNLAVATDVSNALTFTVFGMEIS